jgi:transitional endoplasmic reticulum ATPase
MLALREHITKYQNPEEAKKNVQELKIYMRHFEEAMKKIRPLSMQELDMYKKISEQFGKPEISARGGLSSGSSTNEAGMPPSGIR